MSVNSATYPETSLKRPVEIADSFLSCLLVLLVLTVGQKLIGFARSLLVCRILPAEELGTWAMMNTIILTVSPMVLLSIPASFGRYFETFRGRSQLRGFILQASQLCFVFLVIGVLGLWLLQDRIALFALGNQNLGHLVWYCSMALIPFAAFSFSVEMVLALRQGRLASTANFISTIVLAIASVSLLLLWQPTSQSMVMAFGLAYAIPVLWMYSRIRRIYRDLPTDEPALPWRSTWFQMIPVVFLFWITDFLTNLFFTVDRYMLVGLLGSSSVLTEIGNYESAHVLPLLFSAVTVWIGKMLMPYLAKSWEQGDRSIVSQRANFSIKLVGFVSLSAGLVMVATSGWLYDILFGGKYNVAVPLLPYLVFFYIGCGSTILLMNFYWCAGRAQWGVVALVTGCLTNVAVNFVLVPTYGIQGAAVGTACGMAAQVGVLWAMACLFGLEWDPGLLVLTLCSAVLFLDSRYWLIGAVVLVIAVFLPGVFNSHDRKQLREAFGELQAKFRRVNR